MHAHSRPLTNLIYVLSRRRCLQNYIPPQSLTLSCPVCRQTSILPEKGVAALQNNFFITNLMEVLQRDQECSRPEACNALESANTTTTCQSLSCPNHEGKVSRSKIVLNTRMKLPSVQEIHDLCVERCQNPHNFVLCSAAPSAGDGVLLRVM